MSNSEIRQEFNLEDAPYHSIVIIDNDENTKDNEPNVTQFRVITAGPEPIIDLQYTIHGRVEGPTMRLLGSISFKDSVEEPDAIVKGKIVSGFRLVTSDLRGSKKFIIPGKISAKEPDVSFGKSTAKFY